jgi:DNA-binding transcriptional ArsR family regulator
MAAPRRSGIDRIRTVGRIAVLASAVRQDILDSVAAIGPCSVAELARVLGRSPHGLYHHITRLEQVRLIKLRRTRGAGGRSRVELEVDRIQRLEYRPGDKESRTAVLRVVLAMVRSAYRYFSRAFRPGVARVSGPGRNLWAARARGVLSAKDRIRVHTLLRTLIALFEASRRSAEGGEMHEITFVLSPVVKRSPSPRGKRRRRRVRSASRPLYRR